MPQFNLNDYETVDSRIKRFYKDHPDGRITTDLVDMAGEPGKTRWVVKAAVYRTSEAPVPDGTGLAFEVDGTGMANRTSALENCETSAIGRALANIAYSGDKRASREEMAKAKAGESPAGLLMEIAAKIAHCKTVDELQALWDATTPRTPEFTAAVTVKKKELENADA